MRLNKLTAKDKELFDKFLRLKQHRLSAYAFANIYIWQALFKIYWQIIDNSLCVFFRDKTGCFLYLEPLSEKINLATVSAAFAVMDRYNKNKEISRIENVEEDDLAIYEKLGYSAYQKPGDYLCRRQDLARLGGNCFKSKRSSYNYFIKHYSYQWREYSPKDKQACLDLYSLWMSQRRSQARDKIYLGMLEDSRASLKVLLDDYKKLDLTARLVKINGRLVAFAFGFRLNQDTFCVLYEITDLSVKGLSQFIFRQFCAGLSGYKYINIMDDSGLENLKKVKLSYRPAELVPAYIINRNAHKY